MEDGVPVFDENRTIGMLAFPSRKDFLENDGVAKLKRNPHN